jgi:osmotically-inducible protein OsmY
MKLDRAARRLSHRPHLALYVAVTLIAVALLALSGCTVAGLAIGAAASAGTKVSEERGFGTSVSDDALWVGINRRLLDHDGDLFHAVSLQVHEGRVLLSGEVGSPEARIEAVRIAWQPDGVAEVINELTVTGTDPNEWRDFWIAQKIDGKLLLDGDIRSINYSVESVDGVVYLIGIAQSEAELNRVIDHARDVQYVRRVVNYVRIKTQAASAE